jgi:hypothetical protein
MKEGMAMATNAQKPNIQIWEDRTKVTRDECQAKDPDRLSCVCVALGTYGHIPHEQQNPDQTVLSSIRTLLPEEGEHTPINEERPPKSGCKREHGLLPWGLAHSVYSSF